MKNSETANPKHLTVLRYAMATALSAGIFASFPARAESWTFTPHLGVQGSYSDNVALAAPGQERGDTILVVSPGISILGDGARVKMNFDYTWQSLTYLDHSSNDTSNNMLSATANVEAVEHWFYIDATAGISQQNISAFGPQPVDNINATGNRTSVSSYSVSPYIKGVVGSGVAYQLRFNTQVADSASSQLPRTQTNQWVGSLNGGTPSSVINWGVDYNRGSTAYAASPSNETEAYRGSLYFRVTPELNLSANAGYEKNNSLAGKQSGGMHGFGFQWTPAATTSLVGQRDQRLFGPGYSLAFKHRMPMSALDVALSRDLTTTSTVLFRGLGTTLAQLLANALPPPPAGTPDNRLALARNLLGPSADQVPTLGFLTNQIILQKRFQASYALIGARNVLTFAAFRADSQSMSTGFATTGDIPNSTSLAQKGLSVTWSHTLSGLSSVNTSYARALSAGDGTAGQASTQNSLSVNLTATLSPKTNASFGLRHLDSAGSPSSYHENAIFLSINFLF